MDTKEAEMKGYEYSDKMDEDKMDEDKIKLLTSPVLAIIEYLLYSRKC